MLNPIPAPSCCIFNDGWVLLALSSTMLTNGLLPDSAISLVISIALPPDTSWANLEAYFPVTYIP